MFLRLLIPPPPPIWITMHVFTHSNEAPHQKFAQEEQHVSFKNESAVSL